jgi:hypothetical protein
MIQQRKLENTTNIENYSAFIIKDEHLEYMKFSKSKSVRIDWLMFQLIQFDFFLGHERMTSLLKSGTRYEALFSMLLANEQKIVIENCLRYGTSIGDKDIFLSNSIQ